MITAERRYPPRADLLTLAGMLASVGSLYLAWERHTISQHERMPIPGAYYTNFEHQPGHYDVIGFHTSAHWPITIFAMGCASGLLFRVSAANRNVLSLVQGACSLMVFIVALHWFQLSGFALLPGVILALCAALVLVYATLDRFSGTGAGEQRDGGTKETRESGNQE